MRRSWMGAVGLVLWSTTAAAPSAGSTPSPPPAARALSRSFATVAHAIGPAVVRLEVTGPQGDAIASGIVLDTRGNVVTSKHAFDAWTELGCAARGRRGRSRVARGTWQRSCDDPTVPQPPSQGSRQIAPPNQADVAGGVMVTLADGRRLPAELIGIDDASDVAVARIIQPPSDLSAARFGDSDQAQIGEWVLAVGSPLGLDQTFTAGIISGRPELDGVARGAFLLTDAKVNPGDAGGPLVDLEGQVVGLTALISAGPGGGYGYAIPINQVRRVAQAIVSDGHAAHPYIGVGVKELGELPPADRTLLGALPTAGALVSRVGRGTPAARAGLRPGDVITAVDRRQVPAPAELVSIIERQPVGARVAVSFVRAGQPHEVTVSVEDLTTGAP